ncbi:MAG: hypothetical protein MJ184_01275 [Treponema sp.]|uniref:hypothetical protein n=1 Tax=Treponema sp. TaxID=166 RepID=UPI00298D828E|nr:hypothetical protein [Treponema sp.]MCQ2599976.1 hypothetical protein [Treponema sp.]
MLLAYIAIVVLAGYLGYTGLTCFIAAKPIAGVICSVLFLFFVAWFIVVSIEKREKKPAQK